MRQSVCHVDEPCEQEALDADVPEVLAEALAEALDEDVPEVLAEALAEALAEDEPEVFLSSLQCLCHFSRLVLL